MGTRYYTADEDARLLEHAARRRSIKKLARQIGRSPQSIRRRLQSAHGWRGAESPKQRQLADLGGLSRDQAAELLGVDRNRVVCWIRWGWLTEHTTRGLGRAFHRIDPLDLIGFLERGGALLSYLAPADPFWREMVRDVRAELAARYIGTQALADALGLSKRTLPSLEMDLGMPKIALRMHGSLPSYYERAAIRAWLTDHPQYVTRRIREEL